MTPLAPPSRRGARALILPAALAVTLFALVWSAWLAGSRAARHGPYGPDHNDAIAGELAAGRCVGQTFAADSAGLYRVDVWLATFARANQGPLVLHVRAAPFAADWATVTVDMNLVRDNAYHAFTFQPLALPAGVPAFFCLEAPTASPGNAVTVGGSTSEAFSSGRALWDTGAEVSGIADLKFQLYYRPGARLAADDVLRRLSAGRPGLLGQPTVYVAFIGAVSLLLGLLGWTLGRWALRQALEAESTRGVPAVRPGPPP